MTQVMIAVPSHDTVNVRFANDLAQLFALSAGSLMGQVELHLVIGTYVYEARERLAMEAIDSGATHVLWLDSDMRFPRDAMLRLLAHDLPAAGINYSTRSAPGLFTSRALNTPERLITSSESTGVEEVSALGFGVLLMRTRVLTETLARGGRPIFRCEWVEAEGAWLGEDFSFCRHAREYGARFYVDHDLSKECAHIGSYEYRTENAVPQTEAVS